MFQDWWFASDLLLCVALVYCFDLCLVNCWINLLVIGCACLLVSFCGFVVFDFVDYFVVVSSVGYLFADCYFCRLLWVLGDTA